MYNKARERCYGNADMSVQNESAVHRKVQSLFLLAANSACAGLVPLSCFSPQALPKCYGLLIITQAF